MHVQNKSFDVIKHFLYNSIITSKSRLYNTENLLCSINMLYNKLVCCVAHPNLPDVWEFEVWAT